MAVNQRQGAPQKTEADKQQHAKKDVITRARGFWDRNSKMIIYISSAIIIISGGWLIYKYMFKLPKEEKANEAVYVVQKYFSDFTVAPSDSIKTVLAQR